MPNDAQKKATVNVIEASIVHDLCGLSLEGIAEPLPLE